MEKLYAVAKDVDSFNNIPPLIFLDVHVKWVKHTGLVSFNRWMHPIVTERLSNEFSYSLYYRPSVRSSIMFM